MQLAVIAHSKGDIDLGGWKIKTLTGVP